MTTKDNCLSFNKKQGSFVDCTNNDAKKYSNVNLNQTSKNGSDTSSLVQFQSKSKINEKFAATKSTDLQESQSYDNSRKSLNNSSIAKTRPNIFESFDEEKSENQQWKKNDGINSSNLSNSTLSLHISAYENSTVSFPEEVTTTTDSCDENKMVQMKSSARKQKKNAIQLFNGFMPSAAQSSFEIPRQQVEESSFMNPEVMQFKASQQLLNPSGESAAGNKKVPKEDIWAFQPIGSPFPDNPVKVLNEQNMYVALWYKHGKPIFGRAWNNGGVVECAIPYSKKELTGAKDLGGQIQVLQYKGDHISLGFWYEWIKYKERGEKTDERQFVKCGNAIPIFWKDRPAGSLIGCLDTSTIEASFPHDGIAETVKGEEAINEMYIIVRNIKGSPPFCECSICSIKPPKGGPKAMINEWMDIRCGDPFPSRPLVKALGKSLDTVPGKNSGRYVVSSNMGQGGNTSKPQNSGESQSSKPQASNIRAKHDISSEDSREDSRVAVASASLHHQNLIRHYVFICHWVSDKGVSLRFPTELTAILRYGEVNESVTFVSRRKHQTLWILYDSSRINNIVKLLKNHGNDFPTRNYKVLDITDLITLSTDISNISFIRNVSKGTIIGLVSRYYYENQLAGFFGL